MSNIVSDNIARMVHLYSYKSNTSTSSNPQSVVEYHKVAPDGKTYGILKEGTKYYIKVAPVKDTKVLAEDYDYIGGITNKKRYEYDSYANAYKQFDLKMMSINEAFDNVYDDVEYSESKPEQAEWQIKETKEMRAEIDRYRQIVENVDKVLTEGTNAKRPKVGKGVPEIGKHGDCEPFCKKADGTMNQKTGSCKNAECADDTFNEDPMTTDKVNKLKERENFNGSDKTYSKKAKVDKSGKRKVNEQTALSVNDNPNYMDMSHGTKKGSSAPYCCGDGNCSCDDLIEGECFDDDNMNNPKPETGCGKCKSKPFDKRVNEETMLPDEAAGFEDEEDGELTQDYNDDAPFGYEEDGFSNEGDEAEEYSENDEDVDDFDISIEDEDDEFDDVEDGLEDEEEDLEDAEYNFEDAEDDLDDGDFEDAEDNLEDAEDDLEVAEDGIGDIELELDDDRLDGEFEPEAGECLNEWAEDEPEIYKDIEADFRAIAKPIVLHISKFYSKGDRVICVSLLKEYRKKLMQEVNNIMKGYGYRLYDTGRNDDYAILTYKRSPKSTGPETDDGYMMNESVIDYFGKHPAYRKSPFTLPDDKEIDKWGRDWNDDSAKGGEYGRSKGNGSPYDEELLIDNIVKHFLKKKAN